VANYQGLDAQGDTIDFAADGVGSVGDPHIPHRRITDLDAGASPDIGSTGDAEVTGNGSLIAITKRLRTLFGGGLPAALGQGTMAQSMPVVLPSNCPPIPQQRGQMTNDDITFAAGVSEQVDKLGYVNLGIVTGTLHASTVALGFQVSTTTGGTFRDLHYETGGRVTMTCANTLGIMLPVELAPFRYFKVVALVAALTVNASDTTTGHTIVGSA
jgi:hypothetical protein